jgi:hypothetical protein
VDRTSSCLTRACSCRARPAPAPTTPGHSSLTRESIVDNITLYWLTGTGASAARWYWEFGQALAAAGASGEAPPAVSVPVGFTTFPGELWAGPAQLG